MKYDIEKFISFVCDLVGEYDIFYNLEFNSKFYFFNNGCYELYVIVKHYFKDCKCYIKKDLSHCAISYNDELYDINGKIDDKDDFILASYEDIEYMERYFGINIFKLTNENIIDEINKCRIKGILYE